MTIVDKKVSVVIPCYNESGNIPELYSRLSSTLKGTVSDYEIIFVDNCSTDRSEAMLRDLASKDGRVVVILFSRNFGNSQYGYSAGTEHATGEAVIWMEGDLQDPPEVVSKLIEKWQEGYDVVYGVRPRAVGSFFSRIARRTFYRLFHALSYLDIPVDAGDFSLLDRKVVDQFNAMPERSRFVRGLRAWVGFRHTGVPYSRDERKHGVTSNPSFRRNAWWAKKFIFSFSYAPLAFVSRAAFWGAGLVVLSMGTMLVCALGQRVSWHAAGAFSLVLMFLEVILMSLAVLAESVSIIFEEVKGRPKYIIREIIGR
ncbi:MAG: glycosyltransferase family 2 protein [Patescibacteria group bacterium]